jgi:hypothetical protein
MIPVRTAVPFLSHSSVDQYHHGRRNTQDDLAPPDGGSRIDLDHIHYFRTKILLFALC